MAAPHRLTAVHFFCYVPITVLTWPNDQEKEKNVREREHDDSTTACSDRNHITSNDNVTDDNNCRDSQSEIDSEQDRSCDGEWCELLL
jgi:hypothetical protein